MIRVRLLSVMDAKELYQLVNTLSIEYFHKPFKHTVRFNHRLRTTGGRYIPWKKVIELNPKYFTEMDQDEFIGIIKHELCHYHLHIEGKPFQHRDKEFRNLLKLTGSPRFCRPLPSENFYRYIFKCKSCGLLYSRKRKMDVKRYRCGKCSGAIELKEEL